MKSRAEQSRAEQRREEERKNQKKESEERIRRKNQEKESEERRCRRKKMQKKEDADVRKGSKVAKHCISPMICGSGGSKSRLAKAAGAEPFGEMRDKQLHAVMARSTFRSKNVQNKIHQVRNTFGS